MLNLQQLLLIIFIVLEYANVTLYCSIYWSDESESWILS